MDHTPSYWMQVPLVTGSTERPPQGGIAIVGSGLAGVSAAYWLQKAGMTDVTLLDFEAPKAASLRNCGHILYGTVESMQALVAIKGREAAREIWDYSVTICHQVRETIASLGIDADYRQDGYLVIAVDESENDEIKASIALLRDMGFASDYRDKSEIERLGFRAVTGARYEPGSASAHPVKFRNGLIQHALRQGLCYHSQCPITAVREDADGVVLTSPTWGELHYDAVVLATNAYSPLVSDFFASRRLIEPFRGQIITSAPLQHRFAVTYPHSFDHGYEYALVTPDNRLMIGGWRNHTPHGETGTYDIMPNPLVEKGLKDFVARHYDINEAIRWEYSWAGIMAASQTGLPFIGPTNSPRVFCVGGFNGHGFSWAHGSAKLLADIMVGNPLPAVARFFNPTTVP